MYVNVMTDEQFKQQLKFLPRNFDQITFAQSDSKRDLITAEINRILAEREGKYSIAFLLV